MDLDDTLRDRLSAAATTTTARPLRAATTVRRSAERHRAQRRGGAAVVVVAAAATAVALGSMLGPQLLSAPPAVDPTPSVTDQVTPSPTTPEPSSTEPPPTQTETEAPPEPQVTQQEATAFVEAFRFEDEDENAADLDFPTVVETGVGGVQAHGCSTGTVQLPGVLAQRTAIFPGPDTGSVRQVSVFADASSAASGFADLRSQMRSCHAERTGTDQEQGVERSFVGEQLTLGDESFWVGTKEVVLAGRDLGSLPDEELYFSTAAVLVLHGPTVTVIDDPAYTDQGRADFVESATAEWETLRPQLDPVVPQ